MESFLTPEAISVAFGIIVILIGITYSRLAEINVSASQRAWITAKTTLLVLAVLAVIWAILYAVVLSITNQQPDGWFTLTSGIAGVAFIILSFIISREVINRVVKRWTD